jgi:hypothetical protein
MLLFQSRPSSSTSFSLTLQMDPHGTLHVRMCRIDVCVCVDGYAKRIRDLPLFGICRVDNERGVTSGVAEKKKERSDETAVPSRSFPVFPGDRRGRMLCGMVDETSVRRDAYCPRPLAVPFGVPFPFPLADCQRP